MRRGLFNTLETQCGSYRLEDGNETVKATISIVAPAFRRPRRHTARRPSSRLQVGYVARVVGLPCSRLVGAPSQPIHSGPPFRMLRRGSQNYLCQSNLLHNKV